MQENSLSRRIGIKLDHVLSYEDWATNRDVCKAIKQADPDLNGIGIKRCMAINYNVLMGLFKLGAVERKQSPALGNTYLWRKVSPLPESMITDGCLLQSQFRRESAKKNGNGKTKLIPTATMTENATLSNAMEYLSLAEEACRNAREIIMRIKGTLT